MILYTMMPQEMIFPCETDDYQKQQLVYYQGIPLVVETEDSGYARIIKVMSSDPQHFLNERIYPGTKISFSELEGLSLYS